jgi:hypothetical protein
MDCEDIRRCDVRNIDHEGDFMLALYQVLFDEYLPFPYSEQRGFKREYKGREMGELQRLRDEESLL